jgi:hypothetical protein
MKPLKVLTKAGHSLEEDRPEILECLEKIASHGWSGKLLRNAEWEGESISRRRNLKASSKESLYYRQEPDDRIGQMLYG